jgi:hypothetical protein
MMQRHRKLVWVLSVGMPLLVALCFGERVTRRWRAPTYNVTVPTDFSISEEVVIVGKHGGEYRYSPRGLYLHYHRFGWDGARTKWITGYWNRYLMVQAPIAANEGVRDG